MKKINKTDEEWRKILTPEEFHVLREAGTEPAFNNEYFATKEPGVYVCRACGLELFSSEDKFESGTGWPSFTKPMQPSHVEEEDDDSFGMHRTEIRCARCGSHLGHVFNDGPAPSGQRYCMNSTALKFEQK